MKRALGSFEVSLQPLPNSDVSVEAHLGRICLISANDARLGPRHLRGLSQVAVKML